MKKILFITFEGVSKTVFESQVINHCLYLVSQGYDVNLFLFCTDSKSYFNTKKFMENINYKINYKVIRAVSQKLPFSEFINLFILLKSIDFSYKKITIHARADYSAIVACLAKFFIKRAIIIWDCRGDTYSEQKIYSSFSITLLFKLTLIKLRIFFIKLLSDKNIFVSDALLEIIKPSKPSYIIPCLTNSNLFFYPTSKRNINRESLGISSDSIVFIYSGGINGGYHIFNKVVKLAQTITKQLPNSFFIFLTPDTELATKYLKEYSFNFLINSCNFDLVGSYLFISNYAIFLREESMVNHVASPVKFAEYCLAGLPIIMTTAVEQSTIYAKKCGNFINVDINDIDSFKFNSFVKYDRSVIANRAYDIFARENYINKYNEIYK